MRAELNLLEKIRKKANIFSKEYKRKVVQYHNAKVKLRQFKKGDLVLRKLEAIRKTTTMRKLGPNWKGPSKL